MISKLEDNMYLCDCKVAFTPRVQLCILTDKPDVTGQLYMMTTYLVHTCFSSYFLRHRDAASVLFVNVKIIQTMGLMLLNSLYRR